MSNGGSGSQKSKALAILFIGIVLGITGMGFVAWYVIVKNPASFNNKELHEPPRQLPQVQTAPQLPTPAVSAVSEAQNFEFYKVLPDKPEGGVLRKTPAAKPQVNPPVTKPATTTIADNTSYIVQAGSFQNGGDAEKLKAKLALSGIEAAVQVVTIPAKGVWHRVRLGPYKGLADANSAIATLKQNGVNNATVLHAQ